MNQSPIGIIDSGLGGLTVWRSIRSLLPHESTIFIGDHKFVPYGKKSKAVIRKRVLKILSYLYVRGAKLIVIACNTATVAGIEWYRSEMPNIPIIGVVPVIKTAAEVSKSKKFVVISTPFTTRSKYQKDLIKKFAPHARVFALSTPKLVELVEDGNITGPKANKILKSILDPFVKKGIDVVVLGSTHFAFLKESIRAIVGDGAAVLDSGGAVARQVKRVLETRGELAGVSDATTVFYTTGNPKIVSAASKRLMGSELVFSYANI